MKEYKNSDVPRETREAFTAEMIQRKPEIKLQMALEQHLVGVWRAIFEKKYGPYQGKTIGANGRPNPSPMYQELVDFTRLQGIRKVTPRPDKRQAKIKYRRGENSRTLRSERAMAEIVAEKFSDGRTFGTIDVEEAYNQAKRKQDGLNNWAGRVLGNLGRAKDGLTKDLCGRVVALDKRGHYRWEKEQPKPEEKPKTQPHLIPLDALIQQMLADHATLRRRVEAIEAELRKMAKTPDPTPGRTQ